LLGVAACVRGTPRRARIKFHHGDIVVSAINGNNVTLTNIANNNDVNVGVGAAVAILGGAGAFGVLKKL